MGKGKNKMKSMKVRIIAIALALAIIPALTVFGSGKKEVVSTSKEAGLHGEAVKNAVQKLDKDARDLTETTISIHDNTEKIADSESLKDELRAMANKMHLASDNLRHTAKQIHKDITKVKELARKAEAGKVEYKKPLDEIVDHLCKYAHILRGKHDLVHKILFRTPESHKEYADAIHDSLHKAERIVERLGKHTQELSEIIGISIAKLPVKAQAFPEQYIRMYDKQGKLLRLAAQQVANEAHGHICVCSAIGFRITQIAISQLWGQELPTKGQLEVTYHHPARGHKDVFKYLLGPENVTYKKAGDPKHLTLAQHYTYVFVRKDTGATWKTQMKEGVIPERFFDLRYKVDGFLKGWHEKKPTKNEKAAFKLKFNKSINNVLGMEPSDIFEAVSKP
jgi:hypothetical protein